MPELGRAPLQVACSRFSGRPRRRRADGGGGGGGAITLHPTPYTLHPDTLHPTPCTPTLTPYTLHPRLYTLHPTP